MSSGSPTSERNFTPELMQGIRRIGVELDRDFEGPYDRACHLWYTDRRDDPEAVHEDVLLWSRTRPECLVEFLTKRGWEGIDVHRSEGDVEEFTAAFVLSRLGVPHGG